MQITLEQWQTLVTVVDQGGYAKAAEALGKSQSAVSYAISKLEERLGLAVFRIEGRRAQLTEAGTALYRQAQALLESARHTEALAQHYRDGAEARIRLAIDIIFPEMLVLRALQRYAEISPLVRIELLETALSGTDEALLSGRAELVISGRIPPGFTGDPLLRVRFIAVAHPDHPLHQYGRPLTHADLRQHRQLVVRDSGSRRLDAGWARCRSALDAESAWHLDPLRLCRARFCLVSGAEDSRSAGTGRAETAAPGKWRRTLRRSVSDSARRPPGQSGRQAAGRADPGRDASVSDRISQQP